MRYIFNIKKDNPHELAIKIFSDLQGSFPEGIQIHPFFISEALEHKIIVVDYYSPNKNDMANVSLLAETHKDVSLDAIVKNIRQRFIASIVYQKFNFKNNDDYYLFKDKEKVLEEIQKVMDTFEKLKTTRHEVEKNKILDKFYQYMKSAATKKNCSLFSFEATMGRVIKLCERVNSAKKFTLTVSGVNGNDGLRILKDMTLNEKQSLSGLLHNGTVSITWQAEPDQDRGLLCMFESIEFSSYNLTENSQLFSSSREKL